MFKVVFFVPEHELERVKQACFGAGAGRYHQYEYCCWQTKGVGQFRPLTGSNPHIGQRGQLERVEEYRVEMICDEDIIDSVISALRATHPYEEPAYDVLLLLDY